MRNIKKDMLLKLVTNNCILPLDICCNLIQNESEDGFYFHSCHS